MKCPYKMPLETYYGQLGKMWLVEDAEGKILFFDLTEAKAKYIVTALNSHEKLVNACEKAKWLYDELALSSLGAACKYGNNYEPPTKEDCLAIRELLEQALKAEKL